MNTVSVCIFALSALTLLLPSVSLQKAALLYLIGSIIFPYLHIEGLAIRFEVVYSLWLFVVLLAKTMIQRTSVRVSQTALLYFMWLMVVLMATLMAHGQHVGQFTDILITLNGLLRPLLVLLVFANVSIDPRFVRSAIWIFLGLSIGTNLFTVVQFLGFDVAPKIVEHFYLSPAMRAPFDSLMAGHGRLVRAMSVFESPVSNAVYTLIVILICFNIVLQAERNGRLRVVLLLVAGLAAIAGIMTLSATFLVGIMVMLGILLWHNVRFPMRLFRLARRIAVMCTMALFIVWFSPTLQELGRGQIAFQIQRISTGQLFASRYEPETGALVSLWAACKESPIIGMGTILMEDVFAGDSLYGVVLYQSGLVGLTLYLFVFYWVIRRSSNKKNLPGTFGFINSLVVQMTLLLLALGLGISTFHIRRVSEWYWVVVGISTNWSLKECASNGLSEGDRVM